MNLKHLLFAAVLFIWVGYSNAQSLEFVKGNVRKLNVSGDKLFIESTNYNPLSFGFWVSDGTAEGTKFLKELQTEQSATFTKYKDKTYFIALSDEYYSELWATDGTAEGTYLVKELKPSTETYILFVFKDKMFLSIKDGEYGRELWVSDGTAAGTQLFTDINPGRRDGLFRNSAAIYKNKIYFAGFTQTGSFSYDVELWVSDGTAAGTKLFKDLNPHGISNPRNFTIANDKLYFKATTKAEGTELWVSDGTEDGTFMLKDIASNHEYDPGTPQAFNGKTYFITHGKYIPYKLWVTDGTTAGTTMLEDSVGYKIVGTDEGLLFSKIISITDGRENYALYKTTGEPGGASLVKAIEGGSSTGYPVHFRAANGKWYFAIHDRKDDYDYSNIWETDGSTENTKLVRDSEGNLLEEDREYDLISFNNALFFVMEDENSNASLYRLGSPGTAVVNTARKNFEVVLFPNPASKQLTIKTDEKLIGSNYTVLNISGQTVHSEKINSDNTLLEVGDLPGGTYFVRVQSNDGGSVLRFIKE